MTTLPQKTAAGMEFFSSSASWVDVDATGKVTFKNIQQQLGKDYGDAKIRRP